MASEVNEIIVRVDGQGAITVLNGLGEKIQEVEAKTEKTQQGFTNFQAGLVSLQSGINLAKDAFNFLAGAADTGIAAIERGAQVGDVAESFGKLSEAAGTTAKVFLDDLTKATGSTIANFDLQQKAIESLRAGTKPDEFVELTKAARVLAEQTGGDTKQAMEQLTSAFETGRVKSLQNALGVIDLEKAENDLAKQLGTTRELLSAEGKVMAARTALLEAAQKRTAEFGEITNDAADNLAVFKTAFTNAYDDFAKAISENEVLNKLLGELAEIVKDIDFKPLIDGISELGKIALEALSGIKKLYNQLTVIQKFTGGDVAQTLFGDVVSGFGDFLGGTSRVARALKEYGDSLSTAGKESSLLRIVTEGATQVIGSFGDALEDLDLPIEETVKGIKKVGEQAGTTGVDLDALAKKNAEAAKKWAEEWDKAYEKNLDARIKNVDAQIALVDKQLEAERKAADEAAKIAQERADKIAGAFEQAGADIFTALVSGDQKALEGVLGSLGSTLGSSFGPIGSAIGQFLGDKLTEGILHAFSGRDAEGKLRDELDRFFADAFANNPVLAVIDGELQKITDLNFFRDTSLFENGAFDNFLASLPGKTQEAFNGVGLALGEILGVTNDVAGQLGAIFAENLSGDLNALQLLVQSTGKSFEEMSDAVVESFLDGELSALQAQSALNGIKQIAEKGIPGALGAVDKAFENLVNAGSKGGRALVDALQDIGAEAQELSVNDFGQLAEIIRQKTGASAADIQNLFDELKEVGIDSIEELTNATTNQLLPVLSALEAEGFLKETVNQTQSLIEQVNSLPDKIEKRLNFIVDTKYTGSTKDAVDKGVFNQAGVKLPPGAQPGAG